MVGYFKQNEKLRGKEWIDHGREEQERIVERIITDRSECNN